MPNASPLEWIWTIWALLLWLMATMVVGSATTMLIGRYQDNRNGSVRLLAWQFVIVSLCCFAGLAAAVALGVIGLILPPRVNDLAPGHERALAEMATWLSPVLLFTVATGYGAIALVKIVAQFRLRPYYRAEGRARDDVEADDRATARRKEIV